MEPQEYHPRTLALMWDAIAAANAHDVVPWRRHAGEARTCLRAARSGGEPRFGSRSVAALTWSLSPDSTTNRAPLQPPSDRDREQRRLIRRENDVDR